MDDRDLRDGVLQDLLARGAVQRGRHWRVRCPCPDHDDQHPSCDVDLDQGVFYCRSCHRGGGLRRYLELRGVRPAHPLPPSPRPVLDPRRVWRRTGPQPMVVRGRVDPDYARVADWVRACRSLIAERRRAASALGDTDEAWALLANLADLERQVSMWEAELEAERRDAWP